MAIQYFQPMTNEAMTEVWRSVNKTEASVEEDLKIARAWLNSQPHLPHITLSDNQLRCFLVLAKGSTEKMKMKIDMYFTMRSLYADILFDSHPLSKRMMDVSKYIYVLPLPKFDKDLERVIFLKIKNENPANYDIYAACAMMINMTEVWLLEDFSNDYLVIFDIEHCKLRHLMKFSPVLIMSIYNMYSKAFTTKVTAVHLINAPSFVDQAVYLLKSIIKPKLASRIFVHKDMKSVVDSMDKNVFPRDYGGYEASLDELEAKFFKKYEEYKDYFDQREQWNVNEDLRPSKTTNDEYLGYYGNFKKLDVD